MDSPTSLLRSLESQPKLPFFTRWPNFEGLGHFVSLMLSYVPMAIQMIFNHHVTHFDRAWTNHNSNRRLQVHLPTKQMEFGNTYDLELIPTSRLSSSGGRVRVLQYVGPEIAVSSMT